MSSSPPSRHLHGPDRLANGSSRACPSFSTWLATQTNDPYSTSVSDVPPADPTPPSKRPRLSSPTPLNNTESRAVEGRAKPKETPMPETTGPKRASHACLRCRRRKLRCLGGWPCDRCNKSGNVCDFEVPGQGSSKAGSSAAIGAADKTAPAASLSENTNGRSSKEDALLALWTSTLADPTHDPHPPTHARLEQLESSVAVLLAGIAGGSMASSSRQVYPLIEMPGQHPDRPDAEQALISAGSQTSSQDTSRQQDRTTSRSNLPPPMHITPRDIPRFGSNPLQPNASPVDSGKSSGVRFTTSPRNMMVMGMSPSTVGTGATSPSREDASGSGRKKQAEPEEKLRAAGESLYEAPFKGLLHPQAKKLQSRAASRAASPENVSGRYDRRFGWDKDDPVNTGLVDLTMAQTLFQFFIDHCHPFFPIVNVALDDAFNTIRQSPLLISAMLAVAARFYVRYVKRTASTAQQPLPLLDPSIPHKLANLAEMHLAQTLLRKQHCLADAQASLLISAWGVHPGGLGSDLWVLSSHAAKLMRHLGVPRVLAQAARLARTTEPESDEWEQLESFMPQLRTWLGWFSFDGFLTLGFGRPQSAQPETVDESGFLAIRMNQRLPKPGSTASVGLYGDVYLAGWTQLSQIGRDLFSWSAMLADGEEVAPLDKPEGNPRDLSLAGMLTELNKRLDEWSRLWVWSGSPYAHYLGSFARIARLQSEHMRLCLNSYALKAGPDEDELVGPCYRKAIDAAMSTIQTHYESSQTDLALSFATDYLIITLAQAATFLIRITKSPVNVQRQVGLDRSIVAHYVRMSVDLLESADVSETRLATFLARTIRDVSRSAGVAASNAPDPMADAPGGLRTFNTPGLPHANDDTPGLLDQGEVSHLDQGKGQVGLDELGDMAGDEASDLDNYLQLEQQLDFGLLLSLPGDGGNQGNQGTLGYGAGGFDGEFGFGPGVMGFGVQDNGYGNSLTEGLGLNLPFIDLA